MRRTEHCQRTSRYSKDVFVVLANRFVVHHNIELSTFVMAIPAQY
jgi:hypothetical protein